MIVVVIIIIVIVLVIVGYYCYKKKQQNVDSIKRGDTMFNNQVSKVLEEGIYNESIDQPLNNYQGDGIQMNNINNTHK